MLLNYTAAVSAFGSRVWTSTDVDLQAVLFGITIDIQAPQDSRL